MTTAASVSAALLYAALAAPIYRADSLIKVESRESPLNRDMKDMMALFGANGSPTETEIELVRSRSLVGQVVAAQKLDLDVTPHYLPLVGDIVARLRGNGALAAQDALP